MDYISQLDPMDYILQGHDANRGRHHAQFFEAFPCGGFISSRLVEHLPKLGE